MNLLGKKVAVYGLGVTGTETIKFLADKELSSLVIVNAGPIDSWNIPQIKCQYRIEKVLEDHAQDVFSSCDLILLSPGIPREADILKKAINKSVPIWNEVELAYRYFKGKIIAVTGTNGKTTTVTFLHQLFSQLGEKTFLGGNIGIPFVGALSENNYEYAILELSSFQCESLDKFKAEVNIILNVYDNHGERYSEIEDYRQAKWMMVKNTLPNDLIYIGPGVGKKPFDSIRGVISQVNDDWDEKFQKLFEVNKMKVIGAHNRFNLYTAWLAYNALGFPIDIFKKTLYSFFGVEHRVERLDSKAVIYNDAKSTNSLALVTAVEAISESYDNILLIMGGKKRSSFDTLTPDVIKILENSCYKVLCIGESASDLETISNTFINVETLEKAKEYITNNEQDPVILFSPGHPSFDQYKNYIDRGRHFKKIFGEK